MEVWYKKWSHDLMEERKDWSLNILFHRHAQPLNLLRQGITRLKHSWEEPVTQDETVKNWDWGSQLGVEV
jgi:hypothetical protein